MQNAMVGLSTHVLDTSRGVPGAAVRVSLYSLQNGRWVLVNEGLTNNDGRYSDFLGTDTPLTAGRYKLNFDVGRYYAALSQDTIFPFVEIAFDVMTSQQKLHIPLLLSPYGYSTYRGS